MTPTPAHPAAQSHSRQERRRRDREDERLLRGGIPPRGDGQPVLAMARRLRRILEGTAATRAADAAAEIHGGFDLSLDRNPAGGIACRKGCSTCCASYVAVTGPEVFLIARWLGAGGPEVAGRLDAFTAADGGRTREERMERPQRCPLLTADGACSIYPVRPTACRSLLSFDVSACERIFGLRTGESVPAYGASILLRVRYQAALRAALAINRLPAVSWELTAALARALVTPDAETRWLAGEDVFAGIAPERTRMPEFDASVRDLVAALANEAA